MSFKIHVNATLGIYNKSHTRIVNCNISFKIIDLVAQGYKSMACDWSTRSYRSKPPPYELNMTDNTQAAVRTGLFFLATHMFFVGGWGGCVGCVGHCWVCACVCVCVCCFVIKQISYK